MSGFAVEAVLGRLREHDGARPCAALLGIARTPLEESTFPKAQNRKKHPKESYTKEFCPKKEFQNHQKMLQHPRKMPQNGKNKRWEPTVFEENSFSRRASFLP
eukprot:2025228-Amphidinium_carterae.1